MTKIKNKLDYLFNNYKNWDLLVWNNHIDIQPSEGSTIDSDFNLVDCVEYSKGISVHYFTYGDNTKGVYVLFENNKDLFEYVTKYSLIIHGLDAQMEQARQNLEDAMDKLNRTHEVFFFLNRDK